MFLPVSLCACVRWIVELANYFLNQWTDFNYTHRNLMLDIQLKMATTIKQTQKRLKFSVLEAECS